MALSCEDESGDVLPGAVQQFHHHLIFVKLDDIDGGKVLADAEQVGDGKSEQVSQNGPVDSSMTHEGDSTIRVVGGEFQKFRNDSVVQFLKAFPAVGAKQISLLEAFVHFTRELFAELRQAFPLPFNER